MIWSRQPIALTGPTCVILLRDQLPEWPDKHSHIRWIEQERWWLWLEWASTATSYTSSWQSMSAKASLPCIGASRQQWSVSFHTLERAFPCMNIWSVGTVTRPGLRVAWRGLRLRRRDCFMAAWPASWAKQLPTLWTSSGEGCKQRCKWELMLASIEA